MRKTEHATKAHAFAGYCKHLRKYAKALANRAFRKGWKQNLRKGKNEISD